jgi:hypothetical protein
MNLSISNFNYYEYINNYNDVAFMNKTEALEHYLKYGKKEHRTYNTNKLLNFDYDFYINNYEDVKKLNLNKHDAILNYIRYGKYENKIFIDLSNFDYNIYIKNNQDLQHLNEQEAKLHYFEYGRFENRLNKENLNFPDENRIYDIETNIKDNKLKNKILFFNKSKLKLNYNNIYQLELLNKSNIKSKIKLKINDVMDLIITIISPDSMIHISNILKYYFNKNNWICNIINVEMHKEYAIKYNDYPNHFFLIYCIFFIEDNILLKNNKYIIYQLEQNINNRISIHYNILHDNNKLKLYFSNSRFNLDYSYVNITTLMKILDTSIIYLPIPIGYSSNITNDKKEYDIIFIGSINDRRQIILDNIKTKYNIYIPEDSIYDKDLYNLYKKSKILINIHYYDNAILEQARLNEALISGIRIISEKPYIDDISSCNKYENMIDFIEIIDNSYDELFNKIDKILNNYNTDIIYYQKKILKTITNIDNTFKNIFNTIFNVNYFAILEKDIAVITANIGKYDKEPTNILNLDYYEYFDWYYFTDNIINYNYGWQYINNISDICIDKIHNNNLNMMYAKFYKIQANKLDILNKYKYIIWLDSSIEINNNNFVIDILNLLQNNKNNFYIFEHYIRNTIREEYEISKTIAKYDNQEMYEQINNYYNKNYIDNKLYEAGFFIYKNTTNISKMLNDWWFEIIKYSYQDQLSLPYVIQKNNIIPYLLNESHFIKNYLPGSVWNNKLIGFVRNHNI